MVWGVLRMAWPGFLCSRMASQKMETMVRLMVRAMPWLLWEMRNQWLCQHLIWRAFVQWTLTQKWLEWFSHLLISGLLLTRPLALSPRMVSLNVTLKIFPNPSNYILHSQKAWELWHVQLQRLTSNGVPRRTQSCIADIDALRGTHSMVLQHWLDPRIVSQCTNSHACVKLVDNAITFVSLLNCPIRYMESVCQALTILAFLESRNLLCVHTNLTLAAAFKLPWSLLKFFSNCITPEVIDRAVSSSFPNSYIIWTVIDNFCN